MEKFDTLLAHAGCDPTAHNGAISPSIVLSSTFLRDTDGGYACSGGNVYSRTGNPNRNALEKILAEIEGGSNACTFGSGLAAANAVLQCMEQDQTVILPDDLYFGVLALVEKVFSRWGLNSVQVDMCDIDAVMEALQDPSAALIWLETPSNPLLKICDIKLISSLAKECNVLVAVDATWTPLITQPLELGANIVVHSTTKYFGGHSDVTGGVVIVDDKSPEFSKRLREVQSVGDVPTDHTHNGLQFGGAVPAPFDCWLILRGLRSLSVRLRQSCESAFKIAKFLGTHPRVVRVCYPGLETHPGHDIAKAQMKSFGAMLSILVKGTEEETKLIHTRLRLFTMATSLGATESLVEHRRSVESTPTSPENLLRFSIGLESADALIADLQQALDSI